MGSGCCRTHYQYTLAPYFKCLALHGGMVKRLPGATGTDLFPRFNTRRTVILGGASRPLAATILVSMTGLVCGETASQATRKDNEGATEVATVEEVEVVESRDSNQGRAVTDDAVGRQARINDL